MLVLTSKLRLFGKHVRNVPRIYQYGKYSQATSEVKKSAVKFAHLGHRQIISLEGRDAKEFVQGMVTNDVTLLQEMKCMYAMILSQPGRVLHDVMLYHQKHDEFDKILLECEKESAEGLIKTMKVYKLRKKLTITLEENVKVLQAFSDDPDASFNSTFGNFVASGLDPRVPAFGHRVLVENLLEDSGGVMCDVTSYHRKRFEIGIPEGTTDLPPGKALPLESNLDYMNGVSFHKGCYLGQELTARTKFTGAIRKRIIPVSVNGEGQIEPGEAIYTPKGKKAGKFLSLHTSGDIGLALVRLNYAEEKLATKSGEIELKCLIPSWWPFKDGTEFADGVGAPNYEEDDV